MARRALCMLRAVVPLAWCVVSCGRELGPFSVPQGVTAELAPDMPSIVQVAWKTAQPSRGYVEYGSTPGLGQTTPLAADEALEHRQRLLGLPQDTVVYYRVVTWEDGQAGVSAIDSIRTGTLAGGQPVLTLEGTGHDQFTLVPILGATRAVSVIDSRGNIVWYYPDDSGLDIYRARLAVDGESVLYNRANVSGEPAADSEIVRVSLDGGSESSVSIPLLAHDFVEHKDGTLGAIVVDYRDYDGIEVRGDAIVEVSESGQLSTVFSTWDCFDPSETPGDNPELGWTFANALDYDEGEGAYYLGLRNFSSIVKVQRDSGECEWVLGAFGSSFEFATGSARFLHQHQFQVLGNHLLVMDNDGSLDRKSRVIEYELDFESHLAREIWQYSADPPVYTFVLGEPVRLSDGSTFINWSAAGQMQRVSATGESLWQLNTNAGFVFGFHTILDSLYARH